MIWDASVFPIHCTSIVQGFAKSERETGRKMNFKKLKMSSKEFSLELSYSMMENAVIVIHESIWLYWIYIYIYIIVCAFCFLYGLSPLSHNSLFLSPSFWKEKQGSYWEMWGSCMLKLLMSGFFFKSWMREWGSDMDQSVQCLCLVSEDMFVFWLWMQVVFWGVFTW